MDSIHRRVKELECPAERKRSVVVTGAVPSLNLGSLPRHEFALQPYDELVVHSYRHKSAVRIPVEQIVVIVGYEFSYADMVQQVAKLKRQVAELKQQVAELQQPVTQIRITCTSGLPVVRAEERKTT